MTSLSARKAREELQRARDDASLARRRLRAARNLVDARQLEVSEACQVVAMWEEVLAMVVARDDFEEDTHA